MQRVHRSGGSGVVAAAVAVLVLLLTGATVAAQTETTEPPSTPDTVQSPTTTTDTTTSTTDTSDPTEPEPTSTTTTPTEDPTDPVAPEDAPAQDGDEPAVSTTIPTEPPEGFTREQFDTFVSVVTACGPDPGLVCTRLLEWTGNRTIAEAGQWIATVPLAVAAVILVAFGANRLVRRSIRRYLSRLDAKAARAGEDQDVVDALAAERRSLRMATISSTLASAASVMIFVVATFVALAQFDISLGPLLAGAGIAGAALGFGAQNIVRDFLAGLFVTIEDQYGVGDTIDVGRASGVVEGITLRMTKIRDIEGTLWFVPNGEVKEVGNMTQRWSRVILDIDVAYGADHHEASRLIKEAADAMWLDPSSSARILEEPELWGVEALGESSVAIRVAVKSYPADQWKAARELRGRIKDSFDAAGIEIPFPQRTLWLRTEDDDATKASTE